MAFSRVSDRAYGRYRLITYACEACSVAYTEGESDGERPGPANERD